MLDAWSASTIAWTTEGGVYHEDCVRDLLDEAEATARTEGRRVDQVHADMDLTPLSRYQLHEWESSNASEIEANPAAYSSDLADKIEQMEALLAGADALSNLEDDDHAPVLIALAEGVRSEVEDMVETYAQVICDGCSSPIETNAPYSPTWVPPIAV